MCRSFLESNTRENDSRAPTIGADSCPVNVERPDVAGEEGEGEGVAGTNTRKGRESAQDDALT